SFGHNAYEVSEAAEREKADLLLMTTHGRSGLLHLLMGSVVTQVLKRTRLPVIMLRPTETGHPIKSGDLSEPLSPGRESGPVLVATHARGELGKILLGSVAETVARADNLPVMLVRMTAETEEAVPEAVRPELSEQALHAIEKEEQALRFPQKEEPATSPLSEE